MQLAGKVCLIAGASGAIGTAVARRFYQEGALLALTHHSQAPAAAAEWQECDRTRVLELPLDVRRWEQIVDVVHEVSDRFGAIHVLVNCTGVLGPIGPTSSIAIDAWVQAVETNLLGSFYLTRAVLPIMLAQGTGKIIHFSGGGAAYARPFYTAYSASKAALVRFTESLAEELLETHIDVNTIAPGPVESRMWAEMRAAGHADPRTLEEIRKMEENGGVPPGRAADLAVFLASERSDGLTGRLISAIHDNWGVFDQRIPDIMRSEAGTLRRVPLG